MESSHGAHGSRPVAGGRRGLLPGIATDRGSVLPRAAIQRPARAPGAGAWAAWYAGSRRSRRPGGRHGDVRPGAGADRPGGDRRAHLLFGPLVDRPGTDSRVGQRRAEAPVPAALDQRRDRLRVRPDRARGRQQPARDDDDLPPARRRVLAQRGKVPDLERRDCRRDRHVRLSRGARGADQRVPGRDRATRFFERVARAQGRQRDVRQRPTRSGSRSATTRSLRRICWAQRAKAWQSRWTPWSAAG